MRQCMQILPGSMGHPILIKHQILSENLKSPCSCVRMQSPFSMSIPLQSFQSMAYCIRYYGIQYNIFRCPHKFIIIYRPVPVDVVIYWKTLSTETKEKFSSNTLNSFDERTIISHLGRWVQAKRDRSGGKPLIFVTNYSMYMLYMYDNLWQTQRKREFKGKICMFPSRK